MATHPDRNSDLEKLCDSDPTWPYEAYEFILEAIELASDIQEPGSAEIHLSGRQIALTAKQLAIEWFGLMAPIRTPRDIVTRLNAELHKVLQAPDVKERLSSLAYDLQPSTPQEFATLLRNETEKWAKVVKASGARAD